MLGDGAKDQIREDGAPACGGTSTRETGHAVAGYTIPVRKREARRVEGAPEEHEGEDHEIVAQIRRSARKPEGSAQNRFLDPGRADKGVVSRPR